MANDRRLHCSAGGKPGRLKADGEVIDIDTEAAARLINGASSHAALWIANSDDPQETSHKAWKASGPCSTV